MGLRVLNGKRQLRDSSMRKGVRERHICDVRLLTIPRDRVTQNTRDYPALDAILRPIFAKTLTRARVLQQSANFFEEI
jgi:hypothetical protein